jgi:hypothetical protein
MIALAGSADDKDESERAGGQRATDTVGPGMAGCVPNVSVPHRSGTFMPDRRHARFPSRWVIAMPSSAPATRAAQNRQIWPGPDHNALHQHRTPSGGSARGYLPLPERLASPAAGEHGRRAHVYSLAS